jgi:hypothetical protein
MKFKVQPSRLKGGIAKGRVAYTIRCSLLGRKFADASARRKGIEV